MKKKTHIEKVEKAKIEKFNGLLCTREFKSIQMGTIHARKPHPYTYAAVAAATAITVA